ncbi:MAG: alpha/beta hydrolase [Burkholderiaceae bacterium]
MKLTVNGQAAYAYTGGRDHRADEPAIVFIHGALNDHSVWILQSRYLAHHGRRVLAVDLPGHGRSAGRPLADVGSIAQWVLDAMTAAGIDRATLVGHSMGSLVAMAAAALAPARIDGIALVGTAMPMPVSDVLLQAAATDEARAIGMILKWSHSALNHPPGHPGPGFSIYQGSRQLMRRQKPGTLLVDFNACNDWTGGPAALAQLRCPVLIVSGAQDQMTPPRASAAIVEALAARPDAADVPVTRCTLEHCGHNIMAEQPAALLDALTHWLAGLPRPAAALS